MARKPQSPYNALVPRTRTFALSDIAASTTDGTRVPLGGFTVRLSTVSHASAILELAFEGPGAPDRWLPFTPGSVAKRPDGPFKEFWVRRRATTPSNANAAVFILDDQSDDGSVLTEPPRGVPVNVAGRVDVAIIEGETAGAAGGTGVVSATTLRVSLATDVGLPAGTAHLGTVDVGDTAPTATQSVGLAADSNLVAALANQRIVGYSIRESAAVPAVASVILRNGTLDTDPIIELIELDLNQSRSEEWVRGRAAAAGVRVDVVAGTVDIVVFTAVIA